jgi:hypothetical protein
MDQTWEPSWPQHKKMMKIGLCLSVRFFFYISTLFLTRPTRPTHLA